MTYTCRFCRGFCIKSGKQPNGKQKYYCKICNKYQQDTYRYIACSIAYSEQVIRHQNESCGIRSISRILKISVSTVVRSIKKLGENISFPTIQPGGSYEIDEMRTFIQKKKNECWITYALCKHTKQVVAMIVGRRTKANIRLVIRSLLLSNAVYIATDRLNIYPSLIPGSIHKIGRRRTNHIERNNLTIRTHLKRLSRKTICFSRSVQMLEASLKIYFWAQPPAAG